MARILKWLLRKWSASNKAPWSGKTTYKTLSKDRQKTGRLSTVVILIKIGCFVKK
jgi:hypothetical protein